MPAFEYTALDPRGRTTRGVAEGATARLVRQQLRERGLTPLAVAAMATAAGRAPPRSSSPRIGATDLAVLLRQLATLIQAGTPITDALAAVGRQTDRKAVSQVVTGLRAAVVEGRSLGDAMGDYPAVFPILFPATVAAGEHSGHLDLILERLADYAERRQQLRQRVTLALIYPVLLVVVALIIVAVLMMYVVPQVVQVFDGIGQRLPWLTRVLIATSGFMQARAMVIAGCLSVAAIAGVMLWQRPMVAAIRERLLLALPGIGGLVRGFESARFVRTLGVLTGSGVPVVDALRVAMPVIGVRVLRQRLVTAAETVSQGGSLSAAMERAGWFPPIVLSLVASGEASGRLGEMLERAATGQERELEAVVAALVALLEPLLILTMGAIVLIIVLAILMPIFQLNQIIK